jgi:hypothetical protein
VIPMGRVAFRPAPISPPRHGGRGKPEVRFVRASFCLS